jgi:small conductance mechanosensitive channel
MELLDEYIVKYGETLLDYLPNILISIIILFAGLWAIRMVKRLTKSLFQKRNFEPTLEKFLSDIIGWTLKVLLFVIVISQLGVETTSLIAMLGAAGLAVGLALQGSLANFAGGVLLMIFKPFKVGEFIEAQGQTGTVKEISIFYTKMTTVNNQLVVIPNGKLSNDNIINFTSEGRRRAVITIGISYSSDIKKAREVLIELMKEQENILPEPEPVVFVADLADSSVDLTVRFWTLNEHFWACHFYTIEEAKSRLEAAGIVIPFPQRDVHHFNIDHLKKE